MSRFQWAVPTQCSHRWSWLHPMGHKTKRFESGESFGRDEAGLIRIGGRWEGGDEEVTGFTTCMCKVVKEQNESGKTDSWHTQLAFLCSPSAQECSAHHRLDPSISISLKATNMSTAKITLDLLINAHTRVLQCALFVPWAPFLLLLIIWNSALYWLV